MNNPTPKEAPSTPKNQPLTTPEWVHIGGGRSNPSNPSVTQENQANLPPLQLGRQLGGLHPTVLFPDDDEEEAVDKGGKNSIEA
jgi:hypothetical protein